MEGLLALQTSESRGAVHKAFASRESMDAADNDRRPADIHSFASDPGVHARVAGEDFERIRESESRGGLLPGNEFPSGPPPARGFADSIIHIVRGGGGCLLDVCVSDGLRQSA